MRPMLKKLPLMICMVTVAGCSSPFGKEGYLRDKSGDYTKERVTKPIKVPANFSDAKPLDDALVIPRIAHPDQELPAEFEVPRPTQRLTGQSGEDIYSIERVGNDVWVLAAQNSKEIWLRLNRFFAGKKLSLSEHNAKQGIMETDWIRFDKDAEYGVVLRTIGKLVGVSGLDPMEDSFQIEVREGTKIGTSEIHIQHKGRPPAKAGEESSPVPAEWDNLGERSERMNQALASDMLIFFAGHQDNRSASLQDQNIDIGANIELTQDGNGNPLLTIKEVPYSRSWTAVGDALGAAGVKIIDRNRSAGIYYLPENAENIIQLAEKPGFFARLFGSDKKDKKEAGQDALHLRVSQFPNFIQVSVEKNSATSADKETSEKLLKLVKDNLK